MNRIAVSAVRIAASLVMAAASVASADPALAASPVECGFARVIVQTSDLDLSSFRGRATADHRLQVAAREVCSSDATDRIAQQDCISNALADARQSLTHQVGNTVLLASNR